MTKLVIFDLDDTLSESRQKVSSLMAEALTKLLGKKDVAVITGGTFVRLEIQTLSELPNTAPLARLTLLPQNGTSCFKYEDGTWKHVYAYDLTEDEKKRIHAALLNIFHIEKQEASFPPLTEDKGGQITYSPVGIEAPKHIKEAFDPDHKKRETIARELRKLLPDFEIGIGGLSSIDITRKGMNKSFGVKKILELKHVAPREAIFVGDALFEGGNDASVLSTGVRCVSVSNPEDTRRVIEAIISGKEEELTFL